MSFGRFGRKVREPRLAEHGHGAGQEESRLQLNHSRAQSHFLTLPPSTACLTGQQLAPRQVCSLFHACCFRGTTSSVRRVKGLAMAMAMAEKDSFSVAGTWA